jgi:hypothetical protein
LHPWLSNPLNQQELSLRISPALRETGIIIIITTDTVLKIISVPAESPDLI